MHKRVARITARRKTILPPPRLSIAGWTGSVEKLRQQHPRGDLLLSRAWIEANTVASFRLDGISVDADEVHRSIKRTASARAFRSRIGQRVRNHAALLYAIEIGIRRHSTLKVEHVLRWYTSVSSGLSTGALSRVKLERLESVVRRINFPHLRLGPAIQEIAGLHSEILHDALVPSFHGILARLLLHFHLGRCGLPPVQFSPLEDAAALHDETVLLQRLMICIRDSYSVVADRS